MILEPASVSVSDAITKDSIRGWVMSTEATGARIDFQNSEVTVGRAGRTNMHIGLEMYSHVNLSTTCSLRV
jgi:hypothetical protein